MRGLSGFGKGQARFSGTSFLAICLNLAGLDLSPLSLKRLLQPSSIAVFGGREAHEVVRQCRRMGFSGEIWPVHPTREVVEGYPCFRGVDELPRAPDASFIGVNRNLTIEIVEQLSMRGAGGAVCYASGFSEVDDGKKLNAALLSAAGSMPFLGPNCYGVINYLDGALLWPDQHGGKRVDRGVAILSQSSNIGINLTMQARGLPIAYLIALGNQAQTDLGDALGTLLTDERVSAIGLYIEGFRDVTVLERVMRVARERKIPVVALKSGASDQGAKIAQSHTAAMTGSDDVADALFKRLGIGRAHDLDTLVETLKILHVHGPLKGGRLCSMSCSGGEASLMADTAIGRKINFPELTDHQHQSIAATVHPLVSVSNPLDYHTFAWNKEEDLFNTYSAMLECHFDLAMLVLDFPRADRCSLETWAPAVNAICRAAQKTRMPTAVLASLPESLPEATASDLMSANIAPLCGIRQALDAAEIAAAIGEFWKNAPKSDLLSGPVINSNEGTKRRIDEWEAKQYLAKAEITVPQGKRCSDLEELLAFAETIEFPMALKACSAELIHKSDVAAVYVGISDSDELENRALELFSRFELLLVEEMVASAVCELIVGINQDPVIGPWMLVGSGGIYAE
ncbi:MAG: acetate--CoA ligase family protein, partial [Proteobacteria bacterium]|nr:acetate--CoA ligase family protein [Pseudomonadota bacterium]